MIILDACSCWNICQSKLHTLCLIVNYDILQILNSRIWSKPKSKKYFQQNKLLQKFLWLISMNEHEIFVEWHLFIISIELFCVLLSRLFLNCTHSFSDVINCLPRCQIPFHKWIDFVMKKKGLVGIEVEYHYMFETIVR